MGGVPSYPICNLEGFYKKVDGVALRNGVFFARCHIDSGGMESYKKTLSDLMRKGRGKDRRTLMEVLADDVACILADSGNADKLKSVCKRVQEIEGVGPFFAWQITCDLMESR